MWLVFIYKSGGNPYIAKTEKEQKRILKKYKDNFIKLDTRTYLIQDI